MNVILSFLSPIHTYKDKNENYHISFANYNDILSDNLGKTHSTNESGIRYVLQQLGNDKLDAYIALASEKVRDKCVDGRTEKHIEYFVNRLDEILRTYGYDSDAKDVFKHIDLFENSEKQDYIKAVTEAVHYVNEIRKVGDTYEPVDLYLDISGGMRDSSILILLISRILENDEGINLKKVIYSNFNNDTKEGVVETMTDVYKLLDLVSGINEFIKFGSMKTLNDYFGQEEVRVNVGPELKSLLQAMTDFTKMVQLCRSTVFDKAISELREKLLAYEEYYKQKDVPNITEKLFSGFLTFIHEKYEKLFMEHKSSQEKYIHYMRWCHDNGYLQQCLTMISETFPQVCFGGEVPLLAFSDEENRDNLYQIFKEYVKDGNEEAFYYWLIANYRYTVVENKKKKEFDDDLEKIWKAFKKDLNNAKVEPDYEKLKENVTSLTEQFKSQQVSSNQGNTKKNTEKQFNGVKDVRKKLNDILRSVILLKIRKGDYTDAFLYSELTKINERAVTIGAIDIDRVNQRLKIFYDYYHSNPNRLLEELDANIPILDYVLNEQILEPNKDKFHTIGGLLRMLISGSFSLPKGTFYDEVIGCPFDKFTGNLQTIISLIYDRVLVSELQDINRIIVNFYELKEERNASNHANIGRDNSIGYDELFAQIDGFITRLEEIVLKEEKCFQRIN